MKTYLLAAAVVALGGSTACADSTGKSRLEIASEIAQECRNQIEWGVIHRDPQLALETQVGDCLTTRLRTLDNALGRAATPRCLPNGLPPVLGQACE